MKTRYSKCFLWTSLYIESFQSRHCVTGISSSLSGTIDASISLSTVSIRSKRSITVERKWSVAFSFSVRRFLTGTSAYVRLSPLTFGLTVISPVSLESSHIGGR